MQKLIRKRTEDREEGFTLIELMVVVLIIAILIAIAIPTFLGARKRAQDRAAQSNLRNALTSEKVYYTDFQVYATGTQMTASDIEKSLKFLDAATATFDAREVETFVSPSLASVCLNAKSASGDVFGLKDVSTGVDAGTWYSRSAFASPCTDNAQGGTSKW